MVTSDSFASLVRALILLSLTATAASRPTATPRAVLPGATHGQTSLSHGQIVAIAVCTPILVLFVVLSILIRVCIDRRRGREERSKIRSVKLAVEMQEQREKEAKEKELREKAREEMMLSPGHRSSVGPGVVRTRDWAVDDGRPRQVIEEEAEVGGQ